MIFKCIAIILAVALMLPFGLGISTGLNRNLKIGIIITIVGLGITSVACYLYPQFLIPYGENIEVYEHGSFVRQWLLNVIILGLIISLIGGSIIYISSVIQAWKKRQTLLPFLFGNGENG